MKKLSPKFLFRECKIVVSLLSVFSTFLLVFFQFPILYILIINILFFPYLHKTHCIVFLWDCGVIAGGNKTWFMFIPPRNDDYFLFLSDESSSRNERTSETFWMSRESFLYEDSSFWSTLQSRWNISNSAEIQFLKVWYFHNSKISSSPLLLIE